MTQSKRRHYGTEQTAAERWERLQMLAAAMRIAEMVLDLWRNHLI